MSSLYDTFITFWSYWFGSNLTDTTVIQLLAVTSTVMTVKLMIDAPIAIIQNWMKRGKKQ